jgi:hypothetical protein
VGFRAFSIQALTEIRVPHPSERSAAESKNLLLDPLRKGWETTEAHLDRKDSGRKRASSGGTLFARCPILRSHPEPGAAQKLVVILSEARRGGRSRMPARRGVDLRLTHSPNH